MHGMDWHGGSAEACVQDRACSGAVRALHDLLDGDAGTEASRQSAESTLFELEGPGRAQLAAAPNAGQTPGPQRKILLCEDQEHTSPNACSHKDSDLLHGFTRRIILILEQFVGAKSVAVVRAFDNEVRILEHPHQC